MIPPYRTACLLQYVYTEKRESVPLNIFYLYLLIIFSIQESYTYIIIYYWDIFEYLIDSSFIGLWIISSIFSTNTLPSQLISANLFICHLLTYAEFVIIFVVNVARASRCCCHYFPCFYSAHQHFILYKVVFNIVIYVLWTSMMDGTYCFRQCFLSNRLFLRSIILHKWYRVYPSFISIGK